MSERFLQNVWQNASIKYLFVVIIGLQFNNNWMRWEEYQQIAQQSSDCQSPDNVCAGEESLRSIGTPIER